jgi:hypothetical protein
MKGEVGILNVGAGDTKLSFDPKNPKEVERAKRILTDMLRRGFTLLVQVGEKDGEPLYQRVKRFKEETCEYIIAGDAEIDDGRGKEKARSGNGRRSRRKRGERAVHAASTRAVAVGRTAGG